MEKTSPTIKWFREEFKKLGSDARLEVTKLLSDNIPLPEELLINVNYKVVFPLINIDECKMNGLDSVLEELTELSGKLYLPLMYFGDIKLKIRISDRFRSREISKKSNLFLIVDSKAKIDIKKTASLFDKLGSSNPRNIKTEFFVIPFYRLLYKTYLHNFICMTQIAYPGSLWLDKALIFSRNKKIDFIEPISSILFENGYYNRKWPKLTSINIADTWNYVVRNTTILNEFSKTRIERAFSSFSYLFSRNYHRDIPVSLFWAISGLESLFISGEMGITQQLNEKIQIFLGEITENKRLLKKLYNYRSSLVHGSLSIPLKNCITDDDKYLTELYEMNSFAAMALVASLQKIIKNNLLELNFKYTYQ